MFTNKCYLNTGFTYEVLSPADSIRNLVEFCELVQNGRECQRWISDNMHLSVDRELDHQVCVDSPVKRFCWEYFEML
jgi:hypothetical protein